MSSQYPNHLQRLRWYAPHQAWLRRRGLWHHDAGDAEPERADLPGADLAGANLAGANFSCANLSGANLSGANLSSADLSCANLSGANLSGAKLSDADLSDADLSDADLSDAFMRNAILVRAVLRDANLTGTDLTFADLWGACICSVHPGAKGSLKAKGIEDIPRAPVPGLAAAVLAQIEQHPETHDQGIWHSPCNTRHCCAGWAVELAGDVGRAAERRLGTAAAAALLLGGQNHPFGHDDDPLPWLRKIANLQINGQKP